MIVGHLGDTPETIIKSLNFINELNPDITGFALATPYPGTKLRASAIKRGCKLEKNWEKYYTSQVTYVPPALKDYDLLRVQKLINLNFYSRSFARLKLLFRENKKLFILNAPGLFSEAIRTKLHRPINLKKIPWWYVWYKKL
jgi:radical SAM superfamily enzyme YgiQ (UPF0313 family)